MKTLILLDLTTEHNHQSIKNRAIGASEYQVYSLLQQLSKKYDITCYNHTKNIVTIDNITYKSFKNDLLNDHIDKDTTIIIQRMLPNINKEIYTWISNNII